MYKMLNVWSMMQPPMYINFKLNTKQPSLLTVLQKKTIMIKIQSKEAASATLIAYNPLTYFSHIKR